METDLQFQVVANSYCDHLRIQVTSGCDILVEQSFKVVGDTVTETFVDSELKKSFSFALDTLRAMKRKGGD